MDNLKMHTPNKANENFAKLAQLFPNAVTETINENGEVVRAIDKDILMQEISCTVVEGRDERYQFTWPDKKKSILLANAPIAKTLRPCAEESVGKDGTNGGFDSENLYIEGDNLDALKLLQETYMGKVKMIYVDPPYNTGNDILYKNNYEIEEIEFLNRNNDLDQNGYIMSMNNDTNGRFHTDWINMMYPRLKIAKDLLCDNGCIIISIDHNELINITKICDEIFSEHNRVGIVSIIHKPEGRNQGKYFAASNEFALFYAKNIENFEFNSVILDSDKMEEYEYSDDKGRYKLNSLITKNRGRQGYDKNLKENNPKNHYPIYVSGDLLELSLQEKNGYTAVYPNTKTQERTWRFIKESLQEKITQGEILAVKELDEIRIYEKYREDKGQLIKTHWLDTRYNYAVHGTGILTELMGSGTFDFPKSLYLLEDIIKLTTFSDSIVLDFFSGSATTAHAVMSVNSEDGGKRKSINIQLNVDLEESLKTSKGESKNSIQKNIEFLKALNRPLLLSEIGKERIRRAGAKIKEESSDKKAIKKGLASLYTDKFHFETLQDKNWIEMYCNGEITIEGLKTQLAGTQYNLKEINAFISELEKKINADTKNLDTGFRVLKVDSTNMKDVYYNPADIEQTAIGMFTDNIKEDRTSQDLLFQVMLDLGILLSCKIEEKEIQGKKVFVVYNGDILYLIACFDTKVSEEVVTEIAKQTPYYAVFRDSGYANDSVATNFEQIFAIYSPCTVRRVL